MLNLPRFVFLNGPPESGKGLLTKLLLEQNPRAWNDSFAEPIREMLRVVFFPEEGPIDYTYDLKESATKKLDLLVAARLNQPGTFVGPTVREAMIRFSQDYMKGLFGQDIFGRLLWKRIQEQTHYYDTFVIDDCGFFEEVNHIVNKIGGEACLLIKLYRDGKTYAGDSRGYLSFPGVRTLDLSNNGAPMEMLDALQLDLGNL